MQIPVANLTIYGASELFIKSLLGKYTLRKIELITNHYQAEKLLVQFEEV